MLAYFQAVHSKAQNPIKQETKTRALEEDHKVEPYFWKSCGALFLFNCLSILPPNILKLLSGLLELGTLMLNWVR